MCWLVVMALRLGRLSTVTWQILVPVLRLAAHPYDWIVQFLFSSPRNVDLLSTSRDSAVTASTSFLFKPAEFSHPLPMEIQGRILVYSILGCPHCMRAKNTLMELGLPYSDVRLDVYPSEVREDLKRRTGKSTVPQIFFNGHHIGGNDDLQKLVTTFYIEILVLKKFHFIDSMPRECALLFHNLDHRSFYWNLLIDATNNT